MTARFTSDLLKRLVPVAAEGSQTSSTVANAATTSRPPAVPVLAAAPPTTEELLFTPDHYEANYAYPLLVWLAPPAADKQAFTRLMRLVSERNYLGVAVTESQPEGLEARLETLVRRLRRRFNVHTERVYLLGSGSLAATALDMGLARPDWFAGVAALSLRGELSPRLLRNYDLVRNKRVFFGTCEVDGAAERETVSRLERTLWTGGLSIQTCHSHDERPVNSGVLRALNHWLMSSIEQSVYA